MVWAVNVMAPFLLTSLLLDLVTDRIVNVSSISAGSSIDFSNLQQVHNCSFVPACTTWPCLCQIPHGPAKCHKATILAISFLETAELIVRICWHDAALLEALQVKESGLLPHCGRLLIILGTARRCQTFVWATYGFWTLTAVCNFKYTKRRLQIVLNDLS